VILRVAHTLIIVLKDTQYHHTFSLRGALLLLLLLLLMLRLRVEAVSRMEAARQRACQTTAGDETKSNCSTSYRRVAPLAGCCCCFDLHPELARGLQVRAREQRLEPAHACYCAVVLQ